MITLNTIIKRFEDFADNHFFIRSFSFGSPEDVDLQKFDSYPLMHVVYTGATYEDTTKTLDFEVYIFDLPSHYESKTERQKEIVSDAEQCAEDILADIANGGNIFIFSEDYEVVNATVTPLQEAGSNVLAGVLLELGIQLPYDRSACDAPIDGVQPEGGGFVYARRGLLRMLTQDGTVDVLSVNTIKVANGTLTDEGNGVVSLTTGGGGSLDDLDDVTITDPLDHDALIYDEVSAEWINGAPRALDMAVYNGSGSVIAKGKLLKAIGSHGDKVSVGLFDLDVDSPMYLVGLAEEQLAIGGTGHARTYGELRGINTNAYAIGTILYASGTAGELSSTAGVPAIPVATVTRSQQNTGRLYVRTWTPGNEEPAFSTFAVSGQSNVVANDTRATVTLVSGTGVNITTNATTDSITIASTINSFSNIAVSGQSNVVADSAGDTLTLVAAGGMTITTASGTDTITFDSARLDDDDVTLAGNRTIDVDGNDLIIQNSASNKLIEIQPDAVITAGLSVRSVYGTTAGAITLLEAPNNGGFGVTLQAPAQLTASTTFTLPSADGTNAQVLQTNGSGTLSFASLPSAPNTFGTIAVSGQSNVVADSSTDTLTLVAGTNVTITTDASTDSITIAATGGGATSPAGSNGQIQYNASGSFGAEAALFYDATNNRLSVGGDTSPGATLEVRGAGTTTGSAFNLENSGGTERFKIQDDGRVLVTNHSTYAANTPGLSVTKTGTYWGGISLRHTGISQSQAAANAQDSNTFGIIFPENTTGGLSIFGFTATNQNGNAVKLSGIQGTQTPTTSAFRLQGSKWNGGSGYTTIGNAEPVISYANFATELFIQLGSGAAGFKTTAPTSTTSVTVRGHGTSTNESFRVENSSGTARFVVRDDGGYGFAGGTVGLAQTGYTTFTNLTTDRTCNANATTVEELADILGTLIEDLKTKGIISA
jgi:hypothetical protein